MQRLFPILLFATLLAACTPTPSGPVKISLINNLQIARPDEPIVLGRDAVYLLSEPPTPDYLPLFWTESGERVPSQADDFDGDGLWDEMAFLHSFDAGETAALRIGWAHKDSFPAFEKRTHAHLGWSEHRDGNYVTATDAIRPLNHPVDDQPYTFQFEGPGWENENIAFRSYFDARNAKDIFGKQSKGLHLDSIGLPGSDYHQLADWGMDILKVGKSLGAGGLAMEKNGVVYRLGDTQSAKYQLIADGPVRSVIRLTYDGWVVEGVTYTLTEEITIWAGKYGYESRIAVEGLVGGEALVTGLVNLKNNRDKFEAELQQTVVLATHAKQSENGDFLGMGIVLPRQIFGGFSEAPEPDPELEDPIEGTYFARMKMVPGTQSKFYFFAGWERTEPAFAARAAFLAMVETEAKKLQSPISIGLPVSAE